MKRKKLSCKQRRKLWTHFVLVALTGIVLLAGSSFTLIRDKMNGGDVWEKTVLPSQEMMDRVTALGPRATEVTVGTYVENIQDISLKNFSFQVDFLVWFRWEGEQNLDLANHFRIYRGQITSREITKDYHEGTTHYQLVRCHATVSNDLETIRFPLESHRLRFYIEPDDSVQRIRFAADREYSGVNEGLTISGFDLKRWEVGIFIKEYQNSHNDPEDMGDFVTTEFVTQMEITRNGFGLYAKCYIALAGTILWVLIMMFINIYHQLDPLHMIAPVLFGSITNIMVGANLLPDALQFGLLEYINIWGVLTILMGAVSIINVNRIRRTTEDTAFAEGYGKMMFFTLLVFTVLENIILPLSAWKW